MAQVKITATKNYSMFKLNDENRPRSDRKHGPLRQSLTMHGFDPARPIVCWRDPETRSLEIVDGQHRYHICRELGIPIFYTVTEHRSPRDFNTSSVPWSMDDWIASHIASGNEAVEELDNFRQHYGLPATIAEMLLAGRVGTMPGTLIKSGEVRILDRDFAHKAAATVMSIHEHFPNAKENKFVTAIARCCRVVEFSPGRLVERISKNPGLLKRQPTVDQYMVALEDVYNHAARSKRIPLKFLADQEMQKRNACLNHEVGASGRRAAAFKKKNAGVL